jgi:hypothetical protein
MASMSRDEELVQVDRYLDALLASRFELRAADEPDVDDDLRSAAIAVQRALPRFHPSFAFEERLARRLRSSAPARPGIVLAFLPRPEGRTPDGQPAVERDNLSSAGLRPAARPSAGAPRPAGLQSRLAGVLLGGAIASGVSIAGVSLAGAALLARRRGKPTATAL